MQSSLIQGEEVGTIVIEAEEEEEEDSILHKTTVVYPDRNVH